MATTKEKNPDNVKRGKYSKSKGKRGERLFCALCREQGFNNIRRSVQYNGRPGTAADVIGLEGIHVEVKNVEKLNVWNAIEQAIRDSTEENKGNIPIVAHTKNNFPWLVTLKAEDFFKLYREYLASVDVNNENEKEITK